MRKINIIMLGFILSCCLFLAFPFLSLNNISKGSGTTMNNSTPLNSNISSLNESSVRMINNNNALTEPVVASIPRIITPLKNISEQVNPYKSYSSEPAPMGLADYGINPNTNQYYSYSTTSFLGTAKISSLSTSGGTYSGSVSLQLNVVLKFTASSSTYVYWLQDVAQIYTPTNQLNFLDNVWNMSSSAANIESSGISGSGQIETYGSSSFYYCEDSNTYVQTYPNTIQMKITTSIGKNWEPTVTFAYDAGNGDWTNYDNVTFMPVSGPINNMNLIVDGSQYTPSSNFYDAELIFGGLGGGASTTYQSNSQVDLNLEYYNGYNFQFIPYIYSFGSDTAETISNVNVTSYYYISGGSYFNRLTSGTADSVEGYLTNPALAVFYFPYNFAGTFRIGSSPDSNITFTGDRAQVSINPGTYTIYVGNWEKDYTFNIGLNSIISLPSVPRVPTSFKAVNSYGFVTLSWQQSYNCGSPILHYTIYRGTSPGNETFLSRINSTYYMDNDVSPATTYYYTITATNDVGTSIYSNETSILTPAVVSGVPINVKISSYSNFNTISWNPPNNDGGSPILVYNIYRGTSPGEETYLCAVISSQTHYHDNGVEPGITYYYTIAAVNSAGESQTSTEVSAFIPKSPNVWLIFGIIELIVIGSLTFLFIVTSEKNKRTFGDPPLPQSSLTPQ